MNGCERTAARWNAGPHSAVGAGQKSPSGQKTWFHHVSPLSCSSTRDLIWPFATKTRYDTTAIRLCKKNGCFPFLAELECSCTQACFCEKQLLHLDCPHVLAASTWFDLNNPRQVATTPGLVFVHELPYFGVFVFFVSSVKWTPLNCEKNFATRLTLSIKMTKTCFFTRFSRMHLF